MHYLIDGHNLISQMADIRLSDADDEAQLILRLREWVAASQKRRVTLYFDGGLPGGEAHNLSGPRLRVIFASSGTDADTLIIKQIRRVQNPPEYTLVTNDREIVAAAARRKMPHITADTFARQMALEKEDRAQPDPSPQEAEPLLSQEEVAEWLEMFGPEPNVPRPVRRRTPTSRKQRSDDKKEESPTGQTTPEQPVRPADELKTSGAPLTEAEVAAWLEAFGSLSEQTHGQSGDEQDEQAALRKEIRRRRQERRQPSRPADQMKEAGASLSRDEVEEWLDIFSDREDEDG